MKKKNLTATIVEGEKKEAERKVKRTVRRIVCGCLGGIGLLCTGYFLGVHHRVIKAYIKGEELSTAPHRHC